MNKLFSSRGLSGWKRAFIATRLLAALLLAFGFGAPSSAWALGGGGFIAQNCVDGCTYFDGLAGFNATAWAPYCSIDGHGGVGGVGALHWCPDNPSGCAAGTTWNEISMSCVASAVNGACGTANGGNDTSAPSTNLCGTGTASAVASAAGGWTWTCAGSNGGTTASCSANLSAAVNGACGAASGATYSSAPHTAAFLCNSGTASAVTGTNTWSWTCAGSNGGSTASCSATNCSPVYTGTWVAGACSATCGGGTLAAATCSTGNSADCNPATMPSGSCNTQACSASQGVLIGCGSTGSTGVGTGCAASTAVTSSATQIGISVQGSDNPENAPCATIGAYYSVSQIGLCGGVYSCGDATGFAYYECVAPTGTWQYCGNSQATGQTINVVHSVSYVANTTGCENSTLSPTTAAGFGLTAGQDPTQYQSGCATPGYYTTVTDPNQPYNAPLVANGTVQTTYTWVDAYQCVANH